MNALNSAFPTLSSNANEPPKSFFDVEGATSIVSNVVYALYPINERRGKMRNGFIIVNPTVLEIHKSQKDSKSNKMAKYLINLEEVFNVCIQKEPLQIKSECLAIMDLSETYLIKPQESEYSLNAWFEYILEKARECRSNKHCRPVFREEYFEAAWDVLLIKKPKLKKDYNKHDNVEDLVLKHPHLENRRRLCICSTSFLVFKMEANPSFNVDVPFDKNCFIDLPMNVISNYGYQEKYFFVRIGRLSEIGSGELWMSCESGAAAKAMHEHISHINLRESDRRRAQGIKMALPTVSTRVLKSRAHRERSQNSSAAAANLGSSSSTSVHKSDSNARLRIDTGQSFSSRLRKDTTKRDDNLTPVSSNTSLLNSGLGIKGIDENTDDCGRSMELRLDSSSSVASVTKQQQQPSEFVTCRLNSNAGSFTCKKNSIASLLPFRFGKMSTTNSPAHSELHSPSSTNAPSNVLSGSHCGSTGNVSISAMIPRLASAPSTTRLGTISQTDRNGNGKGNTFSSSVNSSYNCAEDYMTYDATDNNLENFGHYARSMTIGGGGGGGAESRKNSATFSGIIMNPHRQLSMGSSIVPSSDLGQSKMASSSSKDYLEMDENMASGIFRSEAFPLQEVRTYISNSTESCWSPHSSEGSSNVPRAYSLGSKPKPSGFSGDNNRKSTQTMPDATDKTSPIPFHGGSDGGRVGPNSSPLRLRPSSNPNNTTDYLSHLPSHSSVQPPSSSQRHHRSYNHHKHTKHVLLQSMQEGSGSSLEPSANIENDYGGGDNVDDLNSSGGRRGTTTLLAERTTGGGGATSYTLGSGVSVASASTALASTSSAASDDFAELRKRAHSVGSKSWIKPTLRKISNKRNHRNQDANTTAAGKVSNGAGTKSICENFAAEMRTRTDSAGSTGSGSAPAVAAANDRRRNSTRLTTTVAAAAAMLTRPAAAVGPSHPDSQDHVEINFDRDGSCPSIDSPSNRSRNSSFGVQLPSSMRSALDLALSSHRSFVDKSSEKYFDNISAQLSGRKMYYAGDDEKVAVRKHSVPEISQQQSECCSSNNADTPSTTLASGRADDAALPPSKRRSTFDQYTLKDISAERKEMIIGGNFIGDGGSTSSRKDSLDKDGGGVAVSRKNVSDECADTPPLNYDRGSQMSSPKILNQSVPGSLNKSIAPVNTSSLAVNNCGGSAKIKKTAALVDDDYVLMSLTPTATTTNFSATAPQRSASKTTSSPASAAAGAAVSKLKSSPSTSIQPSCSRIISTIIESAYSSSSSSSQSSSVASSRASFAIGSMSSNNGSPRGSVECVIPDSMERRNEVDENCGAATRKSSSKPIRHVASSGECCPKTTKKEKLYKRIAGSGGASPTSSRLALSSRTSSTSSSFSELNQNNIGNFDNSDAPSPILRNGKSDMRRFQKRSAESISAGGSPLLHHHHIHRHSNKAMENEMLASSSTSSPSRPIVPIDDTDYVDGSGTVASLSVGGGTSRKNSKTPKKGVGMMSAKRSSSSGRRGNASSLSSVNSEKLSINKPPDDDDYGLISAMPTTSFPNSPVISSSNTPSPSRQRTHTSSSTATVSSENDINVGGDGNGGRRCDTMPTGTPNRRGMHRQSSGAASRKTSTASSSTLINSGGDAITPHFQQTVCGAGQKSSVGSGGGRSGFISTGIASSRAMIFDQDNQAIIKKLSSASGYPTSAFSSVGGNPTGGGDSSGGIPAVVRKLSLSSSTALQKQQHSSGKAGIAVEDQQQSGGTKAAVARKKSVEKKSCDYAMVVASSTSGAQYK